MIAPAEQLLPTEMVRVALDRPLSEALRAPVGLLCAAVGVGFFSLMPYPAVAVGNYTALQIGNFLVVLLAVPALFVSWRRRPFWVFPLLMAPLCVSAFKAAVVGQDGLDLCLKSLAVWGLSL